MDRLWYVVAVPATAREPIFTGSGAVGVLGFGGLPAKTPHGRWMSFRVLSKSGGVLSPGEGPADRHMGAGTRRPVHGPQWIFLGCLQVRGFFGRLDRGLSLAARWRGAVSGDAFGSEVGLPSGSGAEGVVVLPPLSSLTVSPLFSPCFLGACLWRLGGGWTGPVWCRRLIFRAVPSRIMPAGLKST